MFKLKLSYLVLCLCFITSNLFATHSIDFEHGKWSFKKINNKTCSIFQVPTSEKGDYTNRGAVIFYVFKEGAAEYVRIDAGYPYDSQKYVKVSIDSKNYQFFGEDDSAWSMADDTVIIEALKAGKKMTVVGYSKRGTETTDIYTLIGFTNAYNSLQQDC